MTEYDGWHQPIKPKGEMMSGRDELWRAIEILVELGEKELAFQLRVVYDTNYRAEWKR